MLRTAIIILILTTFFSGCNRPDKRLETPQWDVVELVFDGPSTGNPYMEVELSVVFSNKDARISVPGFYDGDGTYRVRFSPDEQGIWTYETQSNTSDLAGRSGTFRCVPPGKDNHGPVKIVDTFYLEYADGTPYYAVGTTAYQWTSVKQTIQEKTLETLANAPFNKIRMCVFPKLYAYGNKTEPWAHPFEGEGKTRDFSRPNYAFFQSFDNRVAQLRDMGIQADVILFHPYDGWGYSKMGDEMNERYVRHMMARLSAYRNVWWSLANEWDIPEIKDTIDWEGIGTLLHREDPHQRFRGIHNWYSSEDHFYDHSRPWITHTSTQTSQFYNAIKWRNRYQQPLLFDEMRYEGDVPSGWGKLTGEEMTAYFWMAGLSGGYPTHGDTFANQADDSTEVRWWAKGGLLVGESPERIRYFRSVMEEAPVKEMNPGFFPHGDSTQLHSNVYIFSKPGSYYLAYVADAGKTIDLDLEGDTDYTMDVLDTWNMKVVEQRAAKPGRFSFRTELPYTALRFYR